MSSDWADEEAHALTTIWCHPDLKHKTELWRRADEAIARCLRAAEQHGAKRMRIEMEDELQRARDDAQWQRDRGGDR